MAQSQPLTVALIGNPNSGKSTIFNAITGSRQHVGNYPGVTVEKHEGETEFHGRSLHLVDLPGTYSLTAYSVEEIVSRNYILDESPDVVVDIIDSSNLERSLYLATQLLELGVPLVLAFNMSDVALAKGFSIDVEMLSKLLGVPIVSTVGNKSQGIDELLSTCVRVADDEAAIATQRQPNYGTEVEPHVVQLAGMVQKCGHEAHRCRGFAVKLLEGDEQTTKRLKEISPDHADKIIAEADQLRKHIESVCGDSAEIILADRRYGFISGACTESLTQTVELRHERSDQIDAILTHRYLGLPIFVMMMYMVFQFTFTLGNPIVDWLDGLKGQLAEFVRGLGSADNLLISLLADGIIEGVGAVMVFLPLIALLYIGISMLEDSGYMARAAFVLDRLMHKIGLHGKSFIPMLLGFGCTVPAIMSTRILASRRDRITTILILPLMSCGARLPVYVLIIGALFPVKKYSLGGLLEVSSQGLWLFVMYAVGIGLAILSALVFRKTILRGESTSFVMELPPYRLPAIKSVLIHTWERSREYVKKAGTIILAIVIVLWALNTWPKLDEASIQQYDALRLASPADAAQIDAEQQRDALAHSYVGRIGRNLAVVMEPCGFDWKSSTATLGALAAKEVFISQMGVIQAVGADVDEESSSLRDRLEANYTPLQGLCIMLFLLIGTPCVATFAVTVRESSLKWALLQWGYLTVLAWCVAAVVYQLGGALGFAATVG